MSITPHIPTSRPMASRQALHSHSRMPGASYLSGLNLQKERRLQRTRKTDFRSWAFRKCLAFFLSWRSRRTSWLMSWQDNGSRRVLPGPSPDRAKEYQGTYDQRSCKQRVEDRGIVGFQPLGKFVDVEHVGQKALCAHADRKLASVLVQFEKNEAYSKQ